MDHTNLPSPAMADTAPVQAQPMFGGSDVVSVRLQQALALLFPSNLAAKAVLFAVVVALLQLLPMGQTPRMWELPHILLLGLVISYGVFGQRNADDEVVPVAAASQVVDDDESVESYVSKILQGPLLAFEGKDGEDGGDSSGVAKDGGIQAWSSQYYADDPLVVVANAGDASEKPLLLPVRKLKPAARESATGNVSDDGIDQEAELLVPNEEIGYGGGREYATSSPSSVLDAAMALSPRSPPPPPPPAELLGSGRRLGKSKARSFNEYGVGDLKMSGRVGLRSGGGNRFRSNSAIQASRRGTFPVYDPVVPSDNQVDADDELEDMAAASESDSSSFSSDNMVRDGDDEHDNEEDNNRKEDEELEDESSCDEELFELATRPGPEKTEEEDEVDRKADEFIAKFREQIRMQRVQTGRR